MRLLALTAAVASIPVGVVVVSPPVVTADVVYATRLTRRAAGDVTTATPLTPAVLAAVAAAGRSVTADLRLVVAATGTQIRISAPALLDRAPGEVTSVAYAIHEADLPAGLAVGGSVLTELRIGSTAPAARSAAVAPTNNGSNWPEMAADLCACGLWGLPLIPYASRGTLPPVYARLDDAYPAEHLADVVFVNAALVSDFANTRISMLRGNPAQLMNDPEGQMIAEGCRRGGAMGHEMFAAAVARMEIWDTEFADPLYFWVDEPYPRPLVHPCLYWLTGNDAWRKRTVVQTNGALNRARYEIWQGNGTPGNTHYPRSLCDTRQLGNAVYAVTAMARLTADLSTYPGAIPQPQNLAASQVILFVSRTQIDEVIGAVLDMQYASGPYAGSWGGLYQTAAAGADGPAGTPQLKIFDVQYLMAGLIAAYYSAHLSDARKAQIKAAVIAGTRYVNTHTWVEPNVTGPCGYFRYIWPIPGTSTDPGGNPAENDTVGLGAYAATVELNNYAGVTNAWCYAATGLAEFSTQCDKAYAAADDNRYVVNPTYYAGSGQLKKMDQAHFMRGPMLAFRFGTLPIA